MSMIFRVPFLSSTWWQLREAMNEATRAERDVSLSVEVNGRGVPMISVKVGEGVWTPHVAVTAIKWTAADLREMADHLDAAELHKGE